MSCFVFFFKQKTAYELRISDWSSDVCSSDLWCDRRFSAAAADGAVRHPRPLLLRALVAAAGKVAAYPPAFRASYRRVAREGGDQPQRQDRGDGGLCAQYHAGRRSEEPTSELQALIRTPSAAL